VILSFAGACGGPLSVFMGYGMRGRRGAMSWADSEFQDASFGDDRLRQRAIRVCERLAEHPSESIPVACCGRAEVEAAYRCQRRSKREPVCRSKREPMVSHGEGGQSAPFSMAMAGDVLRSCGSRPCQDRRIVQAEYRWAGWLWAGGARWSA